MKKTLLFLMVGLFAVLAWSCSDDDKDLPMSYEMLPQQAQEFVSTYYPSAKAVKVTNEKEHNTTYYEVMLNNGHEITFDAKGEWIEVDAPSQQYVPSAIVPTGIADYVAQTFPAYGVNEIKKTSDGYEIELTNGLDLRFDREGIFVGQI